MEEDALLKALNSSGYLFQLRVQHEIEERQSPLARRHWDFVAREYHWKDLSSGAEGYIDIVLQQERMRMIIECKRVKEEDTHWLFLASDLQQMSTERARLLWTYRRPSKQFGTRSFWDWDDFNAEPRSAEADFCIVWGQSDKSKPMLERYADILLPSLESIAEEEQHLGSIDDHIQRIYIPVVVTNAKLDLCPIHPSKIDLLSGKVQSAEFKSEPYVRFRKTLATKFSTQKSAQDLTRAHVGKERTIFIVHAGELMRFLQEFRVLPPRANEWPWDQYRR